MNDLLTQIRAVFGEPKHISSKLVEDYPDVKAIVPFRVEKHEPYTSYRCYWRKS